MSRPDLGATLAIDVCLGRCSAAVLVGDEVRAAIVEPLTRGHVERLRPVVEAALEQAGTTPQELALIATTVGPGGFTGARLGVALARGVAFATRTRAVGVSTLEALAYPAGPERVAAILDGRRGDAFVQSFEAFRALGPMQAIPVEELGAYLDLIAPAVTVGNGATLAGLAPLDTEIFPEDVARIARMRVRDCVEAGPPAPLYLRAPDAKASAPVALFG